MSTEEALSPRDVVSIGFHKAKEMEDFLASGGSFQDLRLEELSFDESNKRWHVVIGFDTMKIKKSGGPLTPLWNETQENERVLKDLVLDTNGNLVKIENY